MREWSFHHRVWFQLSLAIFVGAVLGLIGPFGSFGHLSVEQRLVHWVSLVAINWGLVVGACKLVSRFAPRVHWHPVVLGAVGGLVAAVPGGLITGALVVSWNWPGAPLPFVQMLAYVGLVNVAIAMPANLLLHQARPAPPVGVVSDAAPPAFLRRIPPRLGVELLAVEAEDHYLRVYTPKGSDLILMRMADAEKELAGLEGARVHRSWWVARSAVNAVTRHRQGVRLELATGLSVPVSRANVAILRRAGWLSPG